MDRRCNLPAVVILILSSGVSLVANAFIGGPGSWKDATGKLRTEVEFHSILDQHRKWLLSTGKEGRRARLSNSDLRGLFNLSHVDLRCANLSNANLSGLVLEGVNLTDANLTQADLSGARLTSFAKLQNADLMGTDLRNTDFTQANLIDAHFQNWGAGDSCPRRFSDEAPEIRRAREIRIDGANFYLADLTNAYMAGLDLRKAHLHKATMKGAHLLGANLEAQDLRFVKFTDAYLADAHLSGADLSGSELEGAELHGADLSGAIFEPKSIPDVRKISGARNLELLSYRDHPDSLVSLRRAFAEGGYREQERELTYAIRKRQVDLTVQNARLKLIDCGPNWLLSPGERNLRARRREESIPKEACGWKGFFSGVQAWIDVVFSRVFLDWTYRYGMEPGRPLVIAVLICALCAPFYVVAIHSKKRSGLYHVFDENGTSRTKRMEKITPGVLHGKRFFGRVASWLWRELKVLFKATGFSIVSAVDLGFGDITIGQWLGKMRREDKHIKAVGWPRVIAGLQSLLTLFLLVLWFRSYFG